MHYDTNAVCSARTIRKLFRRRRCECTRKIIPARQGRGPEVYRHDAVTYRPTSKTRLNEEGNRYLCIASMGTCTGSEVYRHNTPTSSPQSSEPTGPALQECTEKRGRWRLCEARRKTFNHPSRPQGETEPMAATARSLALICKSSLLLQGRQYLASFVGFDLTRVLR